MLGLIDLSSNWLFCKGIHQLITVMGSGSRPLNKDEQYKELKQIMVIIITIALCRKGQTQSLENPRK
ncbi:uncharacterized protein BP01DRAFT_356199 [Aspergillus saccharolyticus JOP 1030-1]|uniref:Uncharacterized protein n=1 Tax=Aspergillus saccharolyticus JOP 1030-1 TaxID=1450539 RepID=A0A319A153_9EURO|nr:hypothetical protein BP01DRAFT_356199 [Aspergillus saccharolyticus JOP 1030-1]PYH46028.1 hypothetical protein BP01DRAFT_356199 [Aspergillus saccharolyticus JOP 1030-1]